MKFLIPNLVLQVATNNTNTIEYTATYVDSNTNIGANPSTVVGLINTSSTVAVVGAPAANVQRQITDLSVFNNSTANALITLTLFDGANTWNLIAPITLAQNESIQYNVQNGFQIYNNQGIAKTSIVGGSSNGGGNGSVTQVSTGTGLTGGPINTTGTISANIATTALQGVTLLIDSTSSTDTGNAATANAVHAATQTAINLAGVANGVAQTATALAISANTEAQTGVSLATTAFGVAQQAYAQANAAFPQVSANSGLVTANSSGLTFNNTATVNAVVTSNGSGASNIGFSVNASAVGGSSSVYANGVLVVANAAIDFITTSTVNVGVTSNSGKADITLTANIVGVANLIANTGYAQANIANTTANAAIALAANAYVLAQTAQTFVYVNGAAVGNSVNLNFVAANTSNLVITGTQNTTPGNVTVTLDTRVVGGNGGGAPPGGSNQQIQFANGTVFGGNANLIYNIAAQLVSAEVNVKISNGNAILFGGSQANTVNTNSSFSMSYNATANSLDIVFI